MIGHTGTVQDVNERGDALLDLGDYGLMGINAEMVELVEGAPNPVPDPRPTVGRIVLFKSPSAIHPAIVTALATDGSVYLTVFDPLNLPYTKGLVPYGDTPGTWHWPPRV